MVSWICSNIVARARGRQPHPSPRRLLDSVTLFRSPDPEVEGHLSRCERCRRKADAMERDWRRLLALVTAAPPASAPDLDSMLARILTVARKVSARPQVPPAWLVDELRLYLGGYSDRLARDSGSSDPRSMLAQVGTILSTFVGRKAAGEFTDRALQAIIRAS